LILFALYQLNRRITVHLNLDVTESKTRPTLQAGNQQYLTFNTSISPAVTTTNLTFDSDEEREKELVVAEIAFAASRNVGT
jgi:hypothetical protein